VRVVIVGGGVFGCCAAYELARSGARVAVIERDPIDVHASSRNPGNLNPILGAPSALVPFAIESLRLHLELSGTLAADGGARYALEPSAVCSLRSMTTTSANSIRSSSRSPGERRFRRSACAPMHCVRSSRDSRRGARRLAHRG
jgi:glycine/D-amino acid oxidase-like deaminating enzyme